MNLKEIDNKIQETLKKAFPNFDVDSFPKKFDEYSFTNPEGCLLTQYVNKNFASSKTIGIVNQNTKVTFNIFVGIRYGSTYAAAYDVLEILDEVLTGIEIEGYSKSQILSEQFLDEIDSDIWHGYTIVFNSKNIEKDKLQELDKLFPDQNEVIKIKSLIAKGGTTDEIHL